MEKNHKGTLMRELDLTDASKTMLTITLWGANAEKFSSPKFTVLLIRRGTVREYDGQKKVSCLSGTLIWVALNSIKFLIIKFNSKFNSTE